MITESNSRAGPWAGWAPLPNPLSSAAPVLGHALGCSGAFPRKLLEEGLSGD